MVLYDHDQIKTDFIRFELIIYISTWHATAVTEISNWPITGLDSPTDQSLVLLAVVIGCSFLFILAWNNHLNRLHVKYNIFLDFGTLIHNPANNNSLKLDRQTLIFMEFNCNDYRLGCYTHILIVTMPLFMSTLSGWSHLTMGLLPNT